MIDWDNIDGDYREALQHWNHSINKAIESGDFVKFESEFICTPYWDTMVARLHSYYDLLEANMAEE